MSRCFPFPPPGYERKHRPEDLGILKEFEKIKGDHQSLEVVDEIAAKRKEKKHKKEKKDKDRKKNKEKEKEGNDGKHREKKDRKKHKDKKDKHRDKKYKEERVKDKEKSSISEEATVSGKIEDQNGEEIHPRGQGQGKSSVVDEGNCSAPSQRQNEGRPSQASMPFYGTEESKFVQELDRRIRDEDKDRGSQLPERVAGPDKRDQVASARAAVGNSSGVLAEERSNNNKDKGVDYGGRDPQGLRNSFSGNAIVQNLPPIAKSKVEGVSGPVDVRNDRWSEGKAKCKETGEDKRRDKRKDRDKKSHGKEKDKEKEKTKEEKVEVRTESKKSEPDKSKDVKSNGIVGITSDKSTYLLKDVSSNAVNEEHFRKRKDREINGFLHDVEIRPSKMHRPALHQSAENGKNVEACSTPNRSASDRHGVPNSVKLDNKDRLVNGIVGAQKPSPAKNRPSAAGRISVLNAEVAKIPQPNSNYLSEARGITDLEDRIAEASRRPPHPDSKYLDEVLKVPKVEALPDNDDHNWLFSKKGPSIKPEAEAAGVKEEPCVWSEAVLIESADICALPYVIPY